MYQISIYMSVSELSVLSNYLSLCMPISTDVITIGFNACRQPGPPPPHCPLKSSNWDFYYNFCKNIEFFKILEFL